MHDISSFGGREDVREMEKKTERKTDLSDDGVIARLSAGNFQPRIGIVGVGGYGARLVSIIDREKPANLTTMIINTDQRSMEVAAADKKIIIGRDITDGTGAGGFREVGYYAGDIARGLIREGLKGNDSLIIVYGAGGGTGSGASLVVAEIANELNMITTGIVMTPFATEKDRVIRAEKDIRRFRELVSNTIVLDNNRFIEKNITLKKAMEMTAMGILKITESMSLQMSQAMMLSIAKDVKREAAKLPEPMNAPKAETTKSISGGITPKQGHAAGMEAEMNPDIPDDPSIN